MSVVTQSRQAINLGMASMRMTYTVKSFFGGYMLRTLCQVVFFSSIGALAAGGEVTSFLLIGMSVYLATTLPMMASASTTWDRNAGTLSLLVASPAALAVVFLFRSWFFILTGSVSSILALAILIPAFGISVSISQAALIFALVIVAALTTYALGVACGGMALRFPHLRNVFSTFVMTVSMMIGGFVVPLDYWPAGFQWVAQIFPGVHALSGIREVMGGGDLTVVGFHTVTAFAVAFLWLVVAALSFWWLRVHGRKVGSIDFED
ncbi:ABC transporter permease [Natronoglycomyces albus]|uniref:Transport permease protein n=1 Tax=Natronoglycomyces albus TaxID=2811108 RepID=A0A895XSG0_9ACTN|nr:ABC transporter permease [Natronoglycomyces albus]QSB05200.1 ABC transporter permease [Natronoglycomyces albus]